MVFEQRAATSAIDGTGWVGEPRDPARLTETGQILRMTVHHPAKNYEMACSVEIADTPRTVAWQPGQASPDTGEIGLGGRMRRYDLEPIGVAQTDATLTCDLSAASPEVGEFILFPPFAQAHIASSPRHC